MNPGPGQRAGVAGIADAARRFRNAAPDLQIRVAAYVPAGNHVAARWTMTGTHRGAPLLGSAARGRRFDIACMNIVRFDAQGRIDRLRHVEELARLSVQIA